MFFKQTRKQADFTTFGRQPVYSKLNGIDVAVAAVAVPHKNCATAADPAKRSESMAAINDLGRRGAVGLSGPLDECQRCQMRW